MKKNIKYSASLILILLSLILGYETFAQEQESTNIKTKQVICTQDAKMCSDGSYVGRSGPNCEFACPEVKNDANREEFKNEAKEIKDNIKTNLVDRKNRLEDIIQSSKEKRDNFKIEIEKVREGAKSKISEMKTNLKTDLKKIKNENKKISAEKIVNIIQGLNTKITNNYSDKLNKTEDVLINIESHITKAESSGLDVSSVKTELEKAKVSIAQAKIAISNQSSKVYTVNITDEANLRSEMKNLRETFSKDIKNLYKIVKDSHTAVKDTSVALSKITKVNDTDDTLKENIINKN